MSDRYLIHIGGSPGSGKSRMSRELAKRLKESTNLSVEHISVGDRVRKLARSAISSSFQEYVDLHLANPHTANERLDESIVLRLLYQGISAASEQDIDVVLLDGYPRYNDQVGRYFAVAHEFNYQTPGALITTTDPETALARMIKRGKKLDERSISSTQAWEKINKHNNNYPNTLHELSRQAIHTTFDIYPIDTTGEKSRTDEEAFNTTMHLIGNPLPQIA
jgi:adenylate kinase family enzyme